MAMNDDLARLALRMLKKSGASQHANYADLVKNRNSEFIYFSPSRPLWLGFDSTLKSHSGFVEYLGDMRLVVSEKEATIEFLSRNELIPFSGAAKHAIGKRIADSALSLSVHDIHDRKLMTAWLSNDGYVVQRFDVKKPGYPVKLEENKFPTMADAVVEMAAMGGSNVIGDEYVERYLDVEYVATKSLSELAQVLRGKHPNYVTGSDRIANGDDYLWKFATNNSSRAAQVANEWLSKIEFYSEKTTLTPDRIRQVGNELNKLAARNSVATPKIEEKKVAMEPKQKWIDLSAYGIYLGDQKMADQRSRLVVLDMENRGDAEKLREIGFVPVKGSPRYDKGIYYLHADDQRMRPKALAAAFGLGDCPLVEIPVSEIDRVFREKMAEKFGANLNAVILRSTPLGQNKAGQHVYGSSTGRFIRMSTDNAISEASEQGKKLGKAAFLRATNDAELRDCAHGFIWTIRQGGKTAWPDLVRFGKVVFSDNAKGSEPSNEQMHRLQEAVEAAAYSRFSSVATAPDEEAFKAATDFYYGLPSARIRTSESIFLQQYSTPLPMSVISQRLLIGNDDLRGKTACEPTAGNGGLVNLLPSDIKIFAVELDRKRFDALNDTGRVKAVLGDATTVQFKKVFGVEDGFDYIIANPPFGEMDAPKSFDKLPNVRKLDHYIPLRALDARKDNGRSVVIFGADSSQSDGVIKGGAKAFLNYIHDHYIVHGLTEIDGRLYSRNGAGLNVRMLVVGDKRATPIKAVVPEKLDILTSYDQLWSWSNHVIEKYSLPSQEELKDLPIQLGEEIRFTPHDLGSEFSIGVVDGTVIDIAKVALSDGKNLRYTVRTNIPAPLRDGFLEKRFYSKDGEIQRISELGITKLEEVASVPGELVISAEIGNAVPIFGSGAKDMIVSDDVVTSVATAAENVDVQSGDTSVSAATGEAKIGKRVFSDAPIDTSVVTEVVPGDSVMVDAPSKKNEIVQPWQMSRKEWIDAYKGADNGTIGDFTRKAGNAMVAMMESREFLRYGVVDWARQKILAAQQGKIKLTDDELAEITDRISTAVDHRDVISKALGEGKNVPANVLADYPDLSGPAERHVNEFQTPYQPASKSGEPSSMVPINMAGATYTALNKLEVQHGVIDEFVARKLQYDITELPAYFSAEQIDAIGLGIKAVEEGRGIINADQTGMGKGRFVAAMLRYAKLEGKIPVFLTIKPELFTDIFRDISDIGSQHLFKKLFIFNEGEYVRKYGTEKDVLYRATTPLDRKKAIENGEIESDVDLVLATYSQFMRTYTRNPKAGLLTEIVKKNGMLLLDESHVASGASNLSATVTQAVCNSDSVLYSSATPLKGVSNFGIYNKVLPASVDLTTLSDTLKAGGEALQEAISANMARDGVLIRREHDFSKLTFHTRNPSPERLERNIGLANELSSIVAELSYLSGDVSRVVAGLNKSFVADWEDIPEKDRHGSRMQASSMNFGSRLYSLNRQFLLGIKVDDAVETALESLRNGQKPIIAVENTGESLLRQVIARRAGVEGLEAELLELEEGGDLLAPEKKERRDVLVSSINDAMRNVVLDEPPQFRELLELMLDRIAVIKLQGRYGEYTTTRPDSKEYLEAEEYLREKIKKFPDLPLTPIDVIKKELSSRGHPVAEVSGRTASIAPNEMDANRWDVKFHPKTDAVSNVAGFQNGKYDCIVITRSGSTGISLHATDRFADSDIRQRNFIVLQKAANIAEFLQWMGRANRKDQVVPPVITGLESGLPAELRLTMMHNSKLRKLSANTTSNRDNQNIEGEDFDLLNDVGERVAFNWLLENPDMAASLDIKVSNDDAEEEQRFGQDCPHINKLMGRLMMVNVDKQKEILKILNTRFADRVDELEQRGENPFKVQVFDWKAEIVKEEELQSGVIKATDSSFDEPVKMVTIRYEQTVFPMRSAKLLDVIGYGLEHYAQLGQLNNSGQLETFKNYLSSKKDEWVRSQLPSKLRESDQSLSSLLARDDVTAAKNAKERGDWLLANFNAFKPGVRLVYNDQFMGERKGVIVSVQIPNDPDDFFLLSKYRAKVIFPGEDRPQEITLATVKMQGKDLASGSWLAIDPANMKLPHLKQRVAHILEEFDDASEGKIIRTHYVLQGNLFRACELANEEKLGYPILFTDADGTRQRAILLKDRVTPEMVKAMPIGFDAKDMGDYVEEYLRPNHPNFRSRTTFGAMRIFDHSYKDMNKGDGIMFEVLNGGNFFRMTVPGTKNRAGALLTDGAIFDIGEKTPASSMRLKLSGTRTYMEVEVHKSDLPQLFQLLQRNHHLGKFYVPNPDQSVIQALKERHKANCEKNMTVERDDSLAP